MVEQRVWKTQRSLSLNLRSLEILSLLMQSDMTGYDIHKGLLSLAERDVSYGSIYPWLKTLEEEHFVESMWVKREDFACANQQKKLYRITENGKDEFTKQVDRLRALLSKIEVVTSIANAPTTQRRNW